MISCSSTVIFSESDKKRSVTRAYLTCIPRRLHGDLPWSRLSRVPWLRTRRTPLSGASYNTGASLQRSQAVPRRVVLDVLALLSWCRRPGRGCSCFLAGGYSISFTLGFSSLSQLQAHLSGFSQWSRGPRARAASGFLHTGAILKALLAGGVSGFLSIDDPPSFLPQGGPLSLSLLLSSSNWSDS